MFSVRSIIDPPPSTQIKSDKLHLSDLGRVKSWEVPPSRAWVGAGGGATPYKEVPRGVEGGCQEAPAWIGALILAC